MQKQMFQGGQILYEVVLGCLRAKGTTFPKWCAKNSVNMESARNALYGKQNGPRAQQIVDGLIEAAGYSVVRVAYRMRIDDEAARLQAQEVA